MGWQFIWDLKKAILVGCDSIFTPITYGYFYGKGPAEKSDRFENNYKDLLEETKGKIDLSVITDTSETRWLPYKTYEQHAGAPGVYRENHELVDYEYLEKLDEAYKRREFGVPIFEMKPV